MKRIVVAWALVLVLAPTAGTVLSEACEGTRSLIPPGPPCIKTVVMNKAFPAVIWMGPPGGAINVPTNTLIQCQPQNGGPCPTVTNVTTTITVNAGAGVCGPVVWPGVPLITNAVVHPAPVCGANPANNPINVPVNIPPNVPAGLHCVLGQSAVTFSDGMVLTAFGDVFLAVNSIPTQMLELELLPHPNAILPGIIVDAPGNQTDLYFRLTNVSGDSIEVDVTALSKQTARRPQGGDESMGVYSIASPTAGDDFPIAFDVGPCEIELPGDQASYQQDPLEDTFILGGGETILIPVSARNHGKCADGSCSEINLLVEGRVLTGFYAGQPVWAVSAASVTVDSSVMPTCSAPQPEAFCDLKRNVTDTAANPLPGASYFGGTVWDGTDSRWEAIPGGTWTFDSGVGSHIIANSGYQSGVNPFKDPSLHGTMEGWLGADRTYYAGGPWPGLGGDWTNLQSLNALPPPVTWQTCNLQDTVLVFQDLYTGGHGFYQNNVAISPWIDIPPGQQGLSGKAVEFHGYFEMPALNYVHSVVEAQYRIGGTLSTFVNPGATYFTGPQPCCTVGAEAVRVDMSHIIPPAAEEVRVSLGVLNFCRFFSSCTGVSNSTPWYDDVRFAVYGSAAVPALTTLSVDRPQDAFPASGTLRLNSPGRLDSGRIKGGKVVEAGRVLGDTLVVRGGQGGAEVRVQFAVDPGPGIDLGRLNGWLGIHQNEGVAGGLNWYSARIDTAEQAHLVSEGAWMTTYHEDDPNFFLSDSQADPIDFDPSGGASHLANDIFPDDLFTPGTRVMLFYKARYLPGGSWATEPDTAGGYFEMEVLPSSADSDSTWNCVLYVDHDDGGETQALVEPALAAAIGGFSVNYEGTPWDRYDVRAPYANQATFGRPLKTHQGATVNQAFGYSTILWDSGAQGAYNLVQQDANVLIPWLGLAESGGWSSALYLAGDNIVSSMAYGAGSSLALLRSFAGTDLVCRSFRDPGCPSGTGFSSVFAVPVDPVGGAAFVGNDGTHTLAGNGDPDYRCFDVLETSGSAAGTALGNERFNDPTKGLVDYLSVTHTVMGAGSYRTVVDGASLATRRAAGNANDPAPITDRLTRVLSWFGSVGSAMDCGDLGAALSQPPPGPEPVPTQLLGLAPNPLTAGEAGRISYTLEEDGPVRLAIYDLAGRQVRTLIDEQVSAGGHTVLWDGRNDSGSAVASGVYFYRLDAQGLRFVRKAVVLGR